MTPQDGGTRAAYARIARWLQDKPEDFFSTRRDHAELMFRRIGITFNVYGDKDSTERLIPFDIIPRVLQRSEWTRLEAGLVQRVNAINRFLADIYGRQEIIKAGVIPAAMVTGNACFRPEMVGKVVPHDIYVHIAGIDVVRCGLDEFYVLEDNVRTPSGVSYMLENREVMMRVAPDLFADHRVAPVENYPDALLAALRSVSPTGGDDPAIAVLTPGPFNSAYYEHSFLADKLGVELVEGRDLIVEDDVVYMRTTEGPKRLDVVYRRIDDDFLDPLAFKADSVLGVPGIMRAYRAGNITIANAVGTASPTTRPSTPTCRRSSASTSARMPSCPTCRPGAAARPTAWPTCSITCPTWSSRRSTGRAATACLWGRMPAWRRSRSSAPS